MKTTTHCEVHPHVHEEYPCSVCVAESNIKQQEEFGRSWADSELRMLRADLAQATKERDEWKAKAEANERDAERYKVVRENIGWILGDQDGIAGCAYSCQLPLATIDTSSEAELLDMVADFCRSAEKEKE